MTTPSTTQSPIQGQGEASTSIAASDNRVRFREAFALSGSVTGTSGCFAPYDLVLEKRAHGSTGIRPFARISTDSEGNWEHTVRSPRSADYLAAVTSTENCEGSRSMPEPVEVRAGVIVRRRHCDSAVGSDGVRGYTQVTARGSVAPNHRGTKVRLQRRKRSGGWRTLAGDRLNARSRFGLFGPTCGGRYRVVWRKQAPENLRGEARFRL